MAKKNKREVAKICNQCGKPTNKLFNGRCKKCGVGDDDFLKYYYRDKKKKG